jgi:adenylate cyclase
VKNIAEPIRAYAVGVAAAAPGPKRKRRPFLAAVGAAALVSASLIAWALYAGAGRELLGLGITPKPVEVASLAAPSRLAGRPSVAVLPFKNLSGDTGQDFFTTGSPRTLSLRSAAFRTSSSSLNRRAFS